MRVLELRRYPVKSMRGERPAEVDLDDRGIVGDRWWAAEDDDGRFASGKSTRRFRRRDAVHAFTGRTTTDGVVVVRDLHGVERAAGDPGLDLALSRRLRCRVQVTPESATPHQDAGAVSVVGAATLAWCAASWGGRPDSGRLRANVVLATREPFEEEGWTGRLLRLGSAVLRVTAPTPRCRMLDLAPTGAAADVPWLSAVSRDRGLRLGVYAEVVRTGTVRVGDRVVVAATHDGP